MDESPPPRLLGRDLATLLTALLVAVVAALGVVAAVRGWIPTGDDAFLSLRSRHVLSSRPILLNNASSGGPSAGSRYNHPGAFPLTLLTPVTALGGPGSVPVATALVNAAWIGAIALMVRRVAGRGAQLGALVACAALAAAMGPDFLVDPWNPTYGIWPVAALVVAAWGVRMGRRGLLAVAVVAASVAFQTHLSLTVLSVTVAGWATIGAVVGWFRRREGGRSIAVAAAAGLVANTQMLLDQVAGTGILGKILRGTGFKEATVSVRQVAAVLASRLALPPWWGRGSWDRPTFLPDLPSTGATVAGLVAVAVVTAVAVWVARRRAPGINALLGVVAVAAVPATIVATRFPLRIGIPLPYFRWVWPLAAVWTAAVVAALVAEVAARAERASNGRAAEGAAAVLVVALAVGVCVPADPALSANPTWAQDIARPFARAAVRDSGGGGPVVIDASIQEAALWVLPALIDQLDAAGIDVRASDEVLVQQTSERYRATGAERRHLAVRGGLQITDAPPGSRLLARHDALTLDERRELERLVDELAADLAGPGAVRLTAVGRAETDAEALDHLTTGELPVAELVESVPFRLALQRGAVAVDGVDAEALDRVTELGARDGGRSIALYAYEAPATAAN